MSIEVDRKLLTNVMVDKINRDLIVFKKESKYQFKKPEGIACFQILSDDKILLPMSYCYHYLPSLFKRTNHKKMEGIPKETKLVQTQEQKEIMPIAAEALNRTGTFILALRTGFGKTACAAYIAWKAGLKTAILCHRVPLIDQWKKTIETFFLGCKVQILTPKSKIDPNAMFYIMNISSVTKFPRESFKDIGFLICDEVPELCSEGRLKAFFHFTPKYSLALSATPYRTDGTTVIIEHFFGPEMVIKRLERSFPVYFLFTDFVPKIKNKKKTKSLNWNEVLDSTCSSEDLHRLSLAVIRYFYDKTILVLSKRVELEGKKLYESLKESKENVDIYTGGTKYFNYDCRVLVSTFSKSGVGFDFPKLNMLLITSDVEEGMLQYLGRVFRSFEHIPIVVDMVHGKFFPFRSHIETRKKIYTDAMGTCLPFLEHFPEFELMMPKER